MARANSGHPRLLVLDDPLQRFDSVLLLPDLLLEMIETLQDQSHINTHLVDILAMTVDPISNMVHLPLVVLKRLLLLDNVSPEIRFQSIVL